MGPNFFPRPFFSPWKPYPSFSSGEILAGVQWVRGLPKTTLGDFTDPCGFLPSLMQHECIWRPKVETGVLDPRNIRFWYRIIEVPFYLTFNERSNLSIEKVRFNRLGALRCEQVGSGCEVIPGLNDVCKYFKDISLLFRFRKQLFIF